MINKNRELHMFGVANYMYQNAEKYNLDKNEMYLLGLMHDIGYLIDEKNHEEIGGEFLKSQNYKYADFIKHHATIPSIYMKLKDCTESEIPKELILLWTADMSIDLNGKNIGFDERLKDIGLRHGKDSTAYKNCEKMIDWLRKYKQKD